MLRNLAKNGLAISIGLLIGFILIELLLHIYNPLPSRIRGNKILLKANLRQEIQISPPIPGLDSLIVHSVNSLGFRGPEPPKNLAERFSIFVVGGSTTECSKLTDEKTWPAILGKQLGQYDPNIWLNNAGIDGCSTYGHEILLDDYLLEIRPDMILFLIGVNDRGKASFDDETGFLINENESLFTRLLKRSEVINLISNLQRAYQAHAVDLGHHLEPKEKPEMTPGEKQADLKRHLDYLPKYEKRVVTLVEKCLHAGIGPVLITQPLLDDPASHGWAVMELYNDVTRKVASQYQVLLIDLATKLEKNPAYYYDNMHYTNLGAEVVGNKVFEDIKQYLTATDSSKVNKVGE